MLAKRKYAAWGSPFGTPAVKSVKYTDEALSRSDSDAKDVRLLLGHLLID